MPGLFYLSKDGKEIQTYHSSSIFAISEFAFTSGSGDRSQATLVDCSSLSAGRTKNMHVQVYDTSELHSVLNLWFAESKEALEEVLATGDPAQFLVLAGSLDVTLPVSASWFAVDYDAGLTTTTLEASGYNISITVV